MVQNLVRSTLSLTFVISAARVVFNIKSRMTRETTWQLELKGDLTKQRRVEAVDKLLSVLTLLVGTVFGLQAVGLDGAPALTLVQALWCSLQHIWPGVDEVGRLAVVCPAMGLCMSTLVARGTVAWSSWL